MRAFIFGLLLACGLTGAAPAQTQTPAAVNGCVYLSGTITLTNGQRSGFLCDVNGKLLTSGGGGSGGVTIGAAVVGCGTSGGVIYNTAGNLVACASGVTTDGTNLTLGSASFQAWSTDLFQTRKGAASLQLGAADAAAPVAQTIGPQSVVAGTSNTAGAAFTIRGSAGTGTGVGGAINFQIANTGSTGSTQNSYLTILQLGVVASQFLSPLVVPNLTSSAFIIASTQGFFNRSNAGQYTFGAADDIILGRSAAASLQLGAADAAAPVAQTFGPQSVVAGTSNTAGAAFTLRGSRGTGTGVGGSLVFQVAPASTTGSTQNTLATALTIDSTKTATFTGATVGPSYQIAATSIAFFNFGSAAQISSSAGVILGGGAYIASPSGNNVDANITRLAAASMAFGNGTNLDRSAQVSYGWRSWFGQSQTTTNFTATSNTTLADITGLSIPVTSGKTYSFKAYLPTTSNIAGGVKAAIGGTATATSIVYDATITDAGAIVQPTRASALGTGMGATAVTNALIEINGTIVVNAGGTLTVQLAQNVSNASASSVLAGSTFIVEQF